METIVLSLVAGMVVAGGIWMANFDHRSGDNEVSIFPQTSFFDFSRHIYVFTYVNTYVLLYLIIRKSML